MARTAATLSKKLGVKAGQQVLLLGAPERWCARFEAEVSAALGDVKVGRQLRTVREPVESIVLFLDCLSDLEDRIVAISDRLLPDGQLWVAWRSRRAVDVNEDVVRRVGLAVGLIDTRVRRVDTVWSAMRLVNRPENRDALAYRLGPDRPITGRLTQRRTLSLSGPGSALQTARARRHRS